MLKIPTLKVNKYKKINIYIRHLGGETFEYLFPHKGLMYQNQIEIRKDTGQRFREYTEDEMEKCISLLQRTAEMAIDDILFQESFKNKIIELKFQIIRKVGNYIYDLKQKTIQKHGKNV